MPKPDDLVAKVAIILVNWNGWQDSVACIESCLALEPSGARIILCDNGSSDGSVEAVVAWAQGQRPVARDPASPVKIPSPRLPNAVVVLDRTAAERGDDGAGAELLVVRTGGNLGFAGGNNVGLRWAMARGFDYMWLLNNDTVVPPDALAHLVAKCRDDARVGLCGSTMVEYYRPTVLQGYAAAIDRRSFRGRHLGAGRAAADVVAAEAADPPRGGEMIYPIGASILVTAAFLAQVGLMEEAYFLYYEEADWVLRGEADFTLAFARNSIVYHKIGAAAGSTPQGLSARSVGYLYRSRLRIARRFAPAAMPRVVWGMIDEGLRGLARGRTARARAALRALTGRVAIPVEARQKP
ncbi:glycosyltransferase family 2 protein [Sphingomonas sp.]|uniref:glycosyltransferase family 2 protein n=1 Tax=Sphingomonas sp. TaxID=28214 RepID=UPI0025DD557C|nr:glycosyltransferase family 2 protein [Sphingomonas sp.]